MQIQKITPTYRNYYLKNKENKVEENKINNTQNYVTMPYNITFEARVDKGLQRFYEANSHRMPSTVKNFIEKLPDKSVIIPLMAQAAAFVGLATAETISDVKEDYPEEELFANLISPDESKATRGLLSAYRENKELMAICDTGILQNKENLTIWLLKEIFLKGKTLEEINTDFNEEVDPEFKKLYDEKGNEGPAIRPSTLKALGIQMPEFEYLQSLRYTRDGYSDIVGDKIKAAQKLFWDSIPQEERTARARKSVERFENWWNSLKRDQQLEMIATQMDELEMLKKFNGSEYGRQRAVKKIEKETKEDLLRPKKEKTGVTSSLSRDDLFKIWAGNHLKIYEANLSEYDKEKIKRMRMQHRAELIASMTSKEYTDYISKHNTGSEPMRFAMIDAWNNNPEILIEMSLFMRENKIEKPTDILYGSREFDDNMSKTMTSFWDGHPEFKLQLGQSIKKAHEKIREQVNNGHFLQLKNDIIKARAQREKDVQEAIKAALNAAPDTTKSYPEYMQDFIRATKVAPLTKFLPQEYFNDFYERAYLDLNEEQIRTWIKISKGEELTEADKENLKTICDLETPQAARMNRALEGALADALYKCTLKPEVYLMSQADCKTALSQILNNEDEICIYSQKLDRPFFLLIQNRDINPEEIRDSYNKYKEPLTKAEINAIIEPYFGMDNVEKYDLAEYHSILTNYLASYGKSIYIAFPGERKYPLFARKAFMDKLVLNMPKKLKDCEDLQIELQTIADFEKEDQLAKLSRSIEVRYSFLPKDVLNAYCYEVNKFLRFSNTKITPEIEKTLGQKRKSADDPAQILSMDRELTNSNNNILFLTMEQALADALYASTRDEKVYALKLEELLLLAENSFIIKKYPHTVTISSGVLNELITLTMRSKLNLYKANKVNEEYLQEVSSYLKEQDEQLEALYKETFIDSQSKLQKLEIAKKALEKGEDVSEEHLKEVSETIINLTNKLENYHNKKSQYAIDKQEILYCLNPDENKELVDKYTKLRLDDYGNLSL